MEVYGAYSEVQQDSSVASGASSTAFAALDLALERLERVWTGFKDETTQESNHQEQWAEQQIQVLKIQAAHWQAAAEKNAKALKGQSDLESGLVQVHAQLAEQEQLTRQWQEKAESWKEEARRAEEARIAAIHNTGGLDIKTVATRINDCLTDAIGNIEEVIKARQSGRER